MTRIDFYQIDSDEAALLFTCRLIDKIYHRGHRIHIHTEDINQAEELDELLWSFRPDRFIPHQLCSSIQSISVSDQASNPQGDEVKVKISHMAEPDHQDILVNLSGQIPEFFSRFTRVAEVVPRDKARRESARHNYKFYRDRGYELHYHQMKGTR